MERSPVERVTKRAATPAIWRRRQRGKASTAVAPGVRLEGYAALSSFNPYPSTGRASRTRHRHRRTCGTSRPAPSRSAGLQGGRVRPRSSRWIKEPYRRNPIAAGVLRERGRACGLLRRISPEVCETGVKLHRARAARCCSGEHASRPELGASAKPTGHALRWPRFGELHLAGERDDVVSRCRSGQLHL
jgi:hypothetical protein